MLNKTILIVAPWSGGPGDGRKLRHFNMLRELDSQGHRVVLLVENTKFRSSKVAVGTHSEIVYIPAFRLNQKYKALLRFVNTCVYTIWSLIQFSFTKGISIVWGSSPHPGATVVAMVLSKILKKPFIYEIRDPWPELPISTGALTEGSLLAKVIKIVDIRAKEASAFIITINDMDLECENYTEKSKLIVNMFPSTLLSEVSIPENRYPNRIKELVFAGGASRAFKLELVIEAVIFANKKGHVNLNLFLSAHETRKFKEIASSLGGGDFITFHENMDHLDLIEKIGGYDYYIMHLTDDPIFQMGINSNKMADSFLAGIPCLFAGNVPGNHVEKSESGFLCDPDSVNELVGLIERACTLSDSDYGVLRKKVLTYRDAKLVFSNQFDGLLALGDNAS